MAGKIDETKQLEDAARRAREAALKIVQRLHDAGYVAYFAGGCVRDELLGVWPKDYDVATDAEPGEVKRLFPRARKVGEAFGVMLVYLDKVAVEVATFRVEWGYDDHRHPSHVEFSDAKHDAQRRDFTINGLFEDPLVADPAARVIDYVNGRADLDARLVRAIGDPARRFEEDYLRLLRAVRFAVRRAFTLEKATARAIKTLAPRLAQISRERIGMEMRAIFAGARARDAVALLEALGLDGPVLDEPAAARQRVTVAGLADGCAYPTALAAWMLDRHLWQGEATGRMNEVSMDAVSSDNESWEALDAFLNDALRKVVARWRDALVLSNDDRDQLIETIMALPAMLRWDEQSIARKKRLMAGDCWDESWALIRAMAGECGDGEAAGDSSLRGFHPLAKRAQAVVARVEAERGELEAGGIQPPPLITGEDLIGLGLRPGPAFGRILQEAYDLQLEGALTTKEAALYWVKGRS